MSSKVLKLFKALVLLTVAGWQGNALAANSAPSWEATVPQVVVRFGDLDLNKPADAAVLYGRIKSAAERVCGEPRQTGSFTVRPEWSRCVAQGIGRAVAAVDRPSLTAYYRVHTASRFQQEALM